LFPQKKAYSLADRPGLTMASTPAARKKSRY